MNHICSKTSMTMTTLSKSFSEQMHPLVMLLAIECLRSKWFLCCFSTMVWWFYHHLEVVVVQCCPNYAHAFSKVCGVNAARSFFSQLCLFDPEFDIGTAFTLISVLDFDLHQPEQIFSLHWLINLKKSSL